MTDINTINGGDAVKESVEIIRQEYTSGAEIAMYLLNASEQSAINRIKSLAASKRKKLTKKLAGVIGMPDTALYLKNRKHAGKSSHSYANEFIDNGAYRISEIADNAINEHKGEKNG